MLPTGGNTCREHAFCNAESMRQFHTLQHPTLRCRFQSTQAGSEFSLIVTHAAYVLLVSMQNPSTKSYGPLSGEYGLGPDPGATSKLLS